MQIAIKNIGIIVSGDYNNALLEGDNNYQRQINKSVGMVPDDEVFKRVVINANGATAIPGLIDSHVHITFGDYTPRQNTVGYLESYLHGGTTTCISASEVHVPGRPKDPEGVKALAIAAKKCFEEYRPGGMRVLAGSIILEPGLTRDDFIEIKEQGVWLAKAGFGAVNNADEYVSMVSEAKSSGLFTTLHTGGASIPGFFPNHRR